MIVGYLTFIAAIAGALFFSICAIGYYADPNQRSSTASLSAVIGLTFSVLTLLTIPLDVYIAHFSTDQTGVKILYYIFFSASLSSSFILLPFATFYHETSFSEHEPTTSERVCRAAKYTLCFVLVLVAMLVIGVTVEPDKHQHGDIAHRLASSMEDTERCLLFAVGVVAVMGLVGWLCYTAVGLAVMPLTLVLGPAQNSNDDSTDQLKMLKSQLMVAKSKAREIEVSYQLSGRTPSRHDRLKLSEHREQIQMLQAEINTIALNTKGWVYKLRCLFNPSAILIGIILAVISMLMVLSIIVVIVDRVINSHCGIGCGFQVHSPPHLIVPLDAALILSSNVFPLDYILLASVVLYMMCCTFMGISIVGIRFFWVEIFAFKKRASEPTALLMAVMCANLTMSSVVVQLVAALPQYTAFGNATQPSDGKQCTLTGDECEPTEISRVFHQIMALPLFGAIFFFSLVAFVLVFFFVTINRCMCQKRKDTLIYSEQEHEDERKSLLSNNSDGLL